jgi:hypothetical protein
MTTQLASSQHEELQMADSQDSPTDVFNLPLYSKRPGIIFAYAKIDPLIAPIVESLGPWYVGKEGEPPRCHYRIPNYAGRQFSLSRVVVAIFRSLQDGKMLEDKAAILKESRRMLRIVFRTRNTLDCRLSNIYIPPVVNPIIPPKLSPDPQPPRDMEDMKHEFEKLFADAEPRAHAQQELESNPSSTNSGDIPPMDKLFPRA